jgi:hypothetical protein
VNKKQALKVLATCLAVATVLSAYYTVRTVVAYREFKWIHYEVDEIDHSDVAWNLTEPDPYILEAIQTKTFVRALRNETTFIDQVREHGDVWEIMYNGTYYNVVCLGSGDPSTPRQGLPKYYIINNRRVAQTQVAAADVSLGLLWVVWAIGWRKTKPKA